MEIIAHRGYWLKSEEKNTFSALSIALEKGYGVETDIRDIDGRLAISHDMPALSSVLYLDDFLEFYSSKKFHATLALNVKSDGLHKRLKHMLTRYGVDNYFVFDMSVPDTFGYLDSCIKTYIRRSDFEYHPELMHLSDGVWMDELKRTWISKASILELFENAKKICIVSAEVHGRQTEHQWQQIKLAKDFMRVDNLMICTDKPDAAERYFN